MKYCLIAFFLEFHNNWFTYDKYAEHLDMDVEHVKMLCDIGKHYHDENVSLCEYDGINRNNLKNVYPFNRGF